MWQDQTTHRCDLSCRQESLLSVRSLHLFTDLTSNVRSFIYLIVCLCKYKCTIYIYLLIYGISLRPIHPDPVVPPIKMTKLSRESLPWYDPSLSFVRRLWTSETVNEPFTVSDSLFWRPLSSDDLSLRTTRPFLSLPVVTAVTSLGPSVVPVRSGPVSQHTTCTGLTHPETSRTKNKIYYTLRCRLTTCLSPH